MLKSLTILEGHRLFSSHLPCRYLSQSSATGPQLVFFWSTRRHIQWSPKSLTNSYKFRLDGRPKRTKASWWPWSSWSPKPSKFISFTNQRSKTERFSKWLWLVNLNQQPLQCPTAPLGSSWVQNVGKFQCIGQAQGVPQQFSIKCLSFIRKTLGLNSRTTYPSLSSTRPTSVPPGFEGHQSHGSCPDQHPAPHERPRRLLENGRADGSRRVVDLIRGDLQDEQDESTQSTRCE